MRFVEYNGDKISKLSLGTVQFGLDYGIANTTGRPAQEAVNEIIDYVIAEGINCFDTAQAYGNSEEVLGEAIDGRDDLYVVSKIKTDLFIKNVYQNIEGSLRRLKVPSLYGLLLHDSKLLSSWSDLYTQKIQELKNLNKIKYFGVSIYTDEEFSLAVKNSEIDLIQIPFNIFDQRAITKGWLEKAKAANKLIFIRSIFLQGLFFMDIEKLPENLYDARGFLIQYAEYAQKLHLSKTELALGFVDAVAKDAVLLFGCDSIEQARENIGTYNQLDPLREAVIEELLLSFENIDENIYNPARW